MNKILILPFFILSCQSQDKSGVSDNSVSASSIDTLHFVIKAGQQVNGLELDMTIQSALDKYGKQSDFNQGISCGKVSYYTNRFFFANNNLVVLSTTIESNETDENLPNSKINEIGILYPANATTDKGISLKSDNLDKIVKTYGEPEKKETSKNNIYLNYYSQGISFDCDSHNNSIKRIVIYKKGANPDFYYWKK